MKHIGLQLYSVGADMGKDVYATLKGLPSWAIRAWNLPAISVSLRSR